LVICSNWLHRILPWKENLIKRFLIGLFLNNCITIPLGLFMIYSFSSVVRLTPTIQELYENYPGGTIKLSIIAFVLTFVYTVGDFLLYSYYQFAVVQIESVRVKRDQLRLQFQALRSQLSPHYLFNSLNTISSLVFRDVRLTEKFIRKLALTYQYILSNNRTQLVKLADELSFLEAYNFLLRVRYENAFRFDRKLDPEILDSFIPPLSLQMLIENAVKHNTISEEVPLCIEIYRDEDEYITVRNNYTGKPYFINIKDNLVRNPTDTSSMKIGLDNIKNRYRFFTSREIKIEKDTYFTVRLPIISSGDAE
ncbi:MAG: histidine kinase, partial [Bacteroidales bacterium]